jgi:hypothetical protein
MVTSIGHGAFAMIGLANTPTSPNPSASAPRGVGAIGTSPTTIPSRPIAAISIGPSFSAPSASLIKFQLNTSGSSCSGTANDSKASPPHTRSTSRRLSFHGSTGRPARAAVCEAR